jgi:hypothetical protein
MSVRIGTYTEVLIRKSVPIRIVKILVLLYYKSITPPSYYLSSSCTVLLLMKKLIVREHTHIHIHTITTLVVNKTIISLDVRRTINAQDVPHAPQGEGGGGGAGYLPRRKQLNTFFFSLLPMDQG